MTEGNNNPEFQGNPESGIDQFLNRSLSQPTIEGLQTKVAELESQLNLANDSIARWMRWHDERQTTINEAKTHIEKAIDNGDISEDELSEPFWTELFLMLGVESHEVVEVEVVATWSVSITKPRGRALHSTDFSAELELDSSDLTFDGYVHSADIDISEN